MNAPDTNQSDFSARWFWAFAIGHLLLWTAVPFLTQANGPLDNVEMLNWGHEWQWGYAKHPPLPAWAAEAASYLPGDPVWSTYLLSQVCIVACFWAAWKLGREFLSPGIALAATVVLEGSVYYNCTTPEFNNNIMAKACWALFILFAYYGIARGRIRDWAAAGLFLAAAVLSKYDAALLLAATLLFSFVNSRARACWKTAGPYVLTGVSLTLAAPHLWWLVSNDFATLRYIAARSSATHSLLSHVAHPAEFLGSQLGAIAVTMILATILLGWRWKFRTVDEAARFTRSYLTWIVLGPLLLALGFSLLTGAHLRSMWGASMFTFVGVLLFAWFEFRVDPALVRRTVYASAVAGICFALGLGVRNVIGDGMVNLPLRVDYPGEQLAAEVEEAWSERSDEPLENLGGDWWLAANVNVYHPERPSISAELDHDLPTWTERDAWKSEGGVIVWEMATADKDYELQLKRQYPNAEILQPLEFAWTKNHDRPPLKIGIAVVQPQTAIQTAAPDVPTRR
ncbi:glycosyltransferase family 39 protein [Blastopirellula sp. JC732]|uniref:Glycosyltransferase family 39 protein n=1 Tax=Blastopirellula sediminis TaxID=2894196 RepID=A0A9X1SJD6_9BACT|nr:glycosyltransferase family 39 protein [Blastopirellula sediminis]MCC9604875.1 glycosyltransferase family 39 protein [Blastopirellula sediminis]MCC9631826.1 glycosyltransferase family 39 protein [Blastopirellula sediminis]